MPSLFHPQWRVYQLKNGKFTTKTWCYNLWLYSFEVICSFHRKPTVWVLYHPKKRQQTSLGKPHKWMAIGKQTRFAYSTCMVLVGMWGRCSPSSQTQVYSPINHTLMGLEFSHSHPIPSLVMDPADVWKSSTDEAANAKKKTIKTAMYWKINPDFYPNFPTKIQIRDGGFFRFPMLSCLIRTSLSSLIPTIQRGGNPRSVPLRSAWKEQGPQRATSIFCSYGSSKNSG